MKLHDNFVQFCRVVVAREIIYKVKTVKTTRWDPREKLYSNVDNIEGNLRKRGSLKTSVYFSEWYSWVAWTLLQELCHYQGSVRDVPDSWVALSTCRGLHGVIFDGENLHHIQPEDESLDSPHYLYKHSDLVANNTCGKHTLHTINHSYYYIICINVSLKNLMLNKTLFRHRNIKKEKIKIVFEKKDWYY